MNPPKPSESSQASQSLDLMLRVNRHCDRREAQWRSLLKARDSFSSPIMAHEEPQSLQEFLRSVPEADRTATAPELVLIDLAYRADWNLPVDAEHFLQQVPWLDRYWLDEQISKFPVRDVAKIPSDRHSLDVHQLGDYEITELLGKGGMGCVYRAVHKIMGRVVALKTMPQAEDPSTRRRFEREVQALAKLSHPNIVTAYDARNDGGVLYLVTELIEGEDLSRRVARKGPLSPEEAMGYICQAARGLAYAHQQGVIHRDIKPSNLILDNEQTIKVLDLGLARLRPVESNLLDELSLTDSGSILGTARYMAPEQARSAGAADERSDIYSLGCTFYFLLSGQPPFRGETEIDTILAHAQQPVPELPARVGETVLPDALRDLVKQMMAKSPDERPRSMSEVVNKLELLVQQNPKVHFTTRIPSGGMSSSDAARQNRAPENELFAKRLSRRRWIGGAAAGVGMGSALFSYYLWTRQRLIPQLRVSNGSGSGRGLLFDGQSNYVQVYQFSTPLTAPFLFQVSATPLQQSGPSNLISWTGQNWGALFMTADGRWGLAWFHAGVSRLIAGTEPAEMGRAYLIGGRCDGVHMQLFVNGREAATEILDFPLDATPLGMFIGGVPDTHLPPNHGGRFFHGWIHTVRIDVGSSVLQLATDEQSLMSMSPDTLICFPFREGSGNSVTDQSDNRYSANVFGAKWTE